MALVGYPYSVLAARYMAVEEDMDSSGDTGIRAEEGGTYLFVWNEEEGWGGNPKVKSKAYYP